MYDTRLCEKKCCGIYGTTPTHNDIKMNSKKCKKYKNQAITHMANKI